MKTYKEEIRKAIDNVICDCCGKSCTPSIDHEYASIEATWGYFSNQDGTQYDIQICETCFTEVLNFMKDKRRKVLGVKYPYDTDPLEGKSYFP